MILLLIVDVPPFEKLTINAVRHRAVDCSLCTSLLIMWLMMMVVASSGDVWECSHGQAGGRR